MGKKHYAPRRRRRADPPATTGIGHEEQLAELLGKLQTPPFLLILDGVQDPQNLGACLRTADAAGVDAVIIPANRAVSLTETVRSVACGAAESVPLIEVTNLARTMRELKNHGVWLVGTSDKAGRKIWDIDLHGSLGIILGAEGKGIRRLTAEHCDFLVSIPMQGRVECLNVSVAAGVCLFEALRQRQKD